jgi:hypothetical protein
MPACPGIECHSGGIHQIVDERLDVVVEVDFIDRDRYFRPREPLKLV